MEILLSNAEDGQTSLISCYGYHKYVRIKYNYASHLIIYIKPN